MEGVELTYVCPHRSGKKIEYTETTTLIRH